MQRTVVSDEKMHIYTLMSSSASLYYTNYGLENVSNFIAHPLLLSGIKLKYSNRYVGCSYCNRE
jgi:hypothetical protein